MRIVGCFLEYNGKFVILFRHAHKPDGSTWGLPGGKVEKGETDHEAIIRELYEETGYKADTAQLEHLGDFPFTASFGTPGVYVTYKVTVAAAHQIELEASAHSTYKWVSPEECDAMSNLITGFHELLRQAGYMQRG
jgi:8-oxo-dGTP pyrophosphatase MutT (NUDIX family)